MKWFESFIINRPESDLLKRGKTVAFSEEKNVISEYFKDPDENPTDEEEEEDDARLSSDDESEDYMSEEEERCLFSEDKKKFEVHRHSVCSEVYGANHQKQKLPDPVEKTEEQKKRIKDRLLNFFMFEALENEEMETLIGQMAGKHLKQGETVIREGEDGSSMFFVDSGELECFKVVPGQPKPIVLRAYSPGDSFGELSLLYNSKRAASVIAKKKSHVFCLDRATFNFIVVDSALEKRRKTEAYLSSVEILKTLEPKEISLLAEVSQEKHFEKNEYIIQQVKTKGLFGEIQGVSCWE